jgi:hypothetical protein
MTQLQIAEKLREQIKEQWPFVSTILALHENINNDDGKFNERIQGMIDKLMPYEVFYQEVSYNNIDLEPKLLGNSYGTYAFREIKSLPINQVLFSSESNPLGILK